MPLRPRAPNACHACRDRKIKCDVSRTGIPCQKCAHAKIDCLVSSRKRRKTKHVGEPRVPLTGVHIFEAHASPTIEHQDTVEETITGLGDPELADDEHDPLPATSLTDLLPLRGDDGSDYDLPRYIIPLRPDLDPGVVHLLRQKKALSLPLQTAREELLGAYICYVHPFLPLLDLEHFLDAVEGKHESRRVSLILFQAVMFAAMSFVDIRHIRAEGFRNRKEARKSFFNRVRLLFDLDVELAPSTLVQVLLLMTYWYDKPGDIKGRSHWMRIALSFANDLGLGQRSELTGLSPHEQKLRRRVWWCCVMRDRLISLSEQRPSNILTDEADFPALSAHDFECSIFCEALKKYSGQSDEGQWLVLTELCFQKVKLCILIGRVLRTQYKPRSFQAIDSIESTILLLPDPSDSAAAEFVARDGEVRRWSSDMCPNMRSMVREDLWRNCSTVSVHCSALEMLYNTVLGFIHRPKLLTYPPEDSVAKAMQVVSRQILRETAQRITQIAKVFEEADLLRLLPPIGVTALLESAMQHTNDVVSSAPSIRSTAQQSLKQTMISLTRLQEMYCSADHAVAFMELIERKESPGESPDLSQMTVFPLFRDEVLKYCSPQRQELGGSSSLDAETMAGSYNMDSNLLSPHQFHAAMDAMLLNRRG